MTTICDDLRKAVLQAAIQGKLTRQLLEDGNAEDLYNEIQNEKQSLIKEGKIKKEKPLPPITEDEIPFEIPENWKWCRLQDVAIKITDGTHHSPPNDPAGDYMYVSAKNIKDSGISLENMTYVTKDVHEEIYSRCNPEFGDVLLIKDGATAGVVTVNNIKEPFSMLSSVALIKVDSGFVDAWYLAYSLRSDLLYSIVREIMKGTGIPRITLKQIYPLYIPLPPLAEQKRIVTCVDNLMKKIDEMERTEKNITALYNSFPGDMKASLLQAAIQGKLTEQLASDGDAETLYQDIQKEKQRLIKEGRIKKEKSLLEITEEEIPFDIPQNWKWVKQSDVCRLYTGNSISEHVKMKKYMRLDIDGYNYIGTKDVSFDHVINYENGVRIPTSEQGFKIAPEGASLICIEGGSAGKKVGFLSQPVCFGNKLCMFNPYLVEQKYIYYWLQSPTFLASFFENNPFLHRGYEKQRKSVLFSI